MNTIEIYKNKYSCLINNEKINILSNLEEEEFFNVLLALAKTTKMLKQFKILDCIEFSYTPSDNGITLADLPKYI